MQRAERELRVQIAKQKTFSATDYLSAGNFAAREGGGEGSGFLKKVTPSPSRAMGRVQDQFYPQHDLAQAGQKKVIEHQTKKAQQHQSNVEKVIIDTFNTQAARNQRRGVGIQTEARGIPRIDLAQAQEAGGTIGVESAFGDPNATRGNALPSTEKASEEVRNQLVAAGLPKNVASALDADLAQNIVDALGTAGGSLLEKAGMDFANLTIGMGMAPVALGTLGVQSAKGNFEPAKKMGTALKEDYKYRYGPFVEGDFKTGGRRALERPATTALDALAVAGAAGAAVKGAGTFGRFASLKMGRTPGRVLETMANKRYTPQGINQRGAANRPDLVTKVFREDGKLASVVSTPARPRSHNPLYAMAQQGVGKVTAPVRAALRRRGTASVNARSGNADKAYAVAPDEAVYPKGPTGPLKKEWWSEQAVQQRQVNRLSSDTWWKYQRQTQADAKGIAREAQREYDKLVKAEMAKSSIQWGSGAARRQRRNWIDQALTLHSQGLLTPNKRMQAAGIGPRQMLNDMLARARAELGKAGKRKGELSKYYDELEAMPDDLLDLVKVEDNFASTLGKIRQAQMDSSWKLVESGALDYHTMVRRQIAPYLRQYGDDTKQMFDEWLETAAPDEAVPERFIAQLPDDLKPHAFITKADDPALLVADHPRLAHLRDRLRLVDKDSSFGAKAEKNQVLAEINSIMREIQGTGKKVSPERLAQNPLANQPGPVYMKHMPKLQRPGGGASGRAKGTRTLLGPKQQKRNQGVLQSQLDYEMDVGRQLGASAGDAAATVRASELGVELIQKVAYKVPGMDEPAVLSAGQSPIHAFPTATKFISVDDLHRFFGQGYEQKLASGALDTPAAWTAENMGNALKAGKIAPGTKYIAMPQAAADVIENLAQAGKGTAFNNWFTAPWKRYTLALAPRWYINNLVGNTMMFGFSNSDDFGMITQAGKQFRRGGKAAKLKKIAKEAVDDDGLASEVYQSSRQGMPKLYGGRTGERVTNLGMRINQKFENWIRRQHYITKRNKRLRQAGIAKDRRHLPTDEIFKDPKAAARFDQQLMKEFYDTLGDYMRFSPMEQKFLRQAFPFYSWFRVIGTVMAKMPLNAPIRTAMATRVGEIFNQEVNPEDPFLPLYQRGMVSVKEMTGGLYDGPGADFEMRMNSASPYRTFDEVGGALFGGDFQNAFGGIVQAANPIGQFAAQQFAGVDNFGRAVTGGGTLDEPVQFGKGQYKVDPVTGNVQTETVKPAIADSLLSTVPGFNAAYPMVKAGLASLVGRGQKAKGDTSILDEMATYLNVSIPGIAEKADHPSELYWGPREDERGVRPVGGVKAPFYSWAGAPLHRKDIARIQAKWKEAHEDYKKARESKKTKMENERREWDDWFR